MNPSSPFENKTDLELIRLVKSDGDSQAYEEICRRYENIFYKVCQKYSTPLFIAGVNPTEIFEEKSFIIYHCITSFDPSKKTKLSTWIGNYARYLCLNTINSRKFVLPTSEEDMAKHIENSQHPKRVMSEDYDYFLNIISQLKDKRVAQIFKYRYCNDKKLKWSIIADKMKISAQTAINLHNKGMRLLRRKVKSEQISDVV